ncbi:selenium cofactor biosynthesis protein YqeC [Desulfobacula sp.]
MTTQLIDALQLNGQGVISIIGAGGKTSLMFQLAKQLADSGKTVLTTTTTKLFMPTPDQTPFTIIAGSIDELIKKSGPRLKQYHHFSAGKGVDLATGKLLGFSPDIIDQLWQARLFDWIIVEADGAKQKPLKAMAAHEPVIPKATTHLVFVTGLDAVGCCLDETHVHRAALFSSAIDLALGETIDETSIAKSIGIEIKKIGHLNSVLSNIVFLNKADTRDRIRSGQKIAALLKTQKTIHRVIIAALIDNTPVKNCFKF